MGNLLRQRPVHMLSFATERIVTYSISIEFIMKKSLWNSTEWIPSGTARHDNYDTGVGTGLYLVVAATDHCTQAHPWRRLN